MTGATPPKTFRQDHPVRFADVDAAGIVYYPRLLDYCHLTFEDFFERAGDRAYSSWIREGRVGLPTAHLDVDFLSMIQYGDSLTMTARLIRIGGRSVVFRFEGELTDGTVAFRADVTKVCAGMDDGKPTDIPDAMRTLFAEYLHPDLAPEGNSTP